VIKKDNHETCGFSSRLGSIEAKEFMLLIQSKSAKNSLKNIAKEEKTHRHSGKTIHPISKNERTIKELLWATHTVLLLANHQCPFRTSSSSPQTIRIQLLQRMQSEVTNSSFKNTLKTHC